MQVERMYYPLETLGYGKRLGIWTIGCPHGCPGCSNPELWQSNSEKDIPLETIFQMIQSINGPIDGVTITGGEPFFQHEDLANLVEFMKTEITDDILIYSGYTLQQLQTFAKSHIKNAITWAERIEVNRLPVVDLKEQLLAIEPLVEINPQQEREILNHDVIYWHLYGYLYKMAEHYFKSKKFDSAALLTYRCLEMIVQRLLLKKNIYSANPSYHHLDVPNLLNRMNEIGSTVYPNFRPARDLPPKIGLMNGLIILRCLEEPIIRDVNLRMMQEMVKLRNKSRLVHGFELLQETGVKDFFGRVRGLTEFYWNHEKLKLNYHENFQHFSKRFEFVNISKIRNQQRMFV